MAILLSLTKPKILTIFISVGFLVQLMQFYIASNTSRKLRHSNVHIENRQNRPLLLFVAVLNKVTSFERRNAVRQTWMPRCNDFNGRVKCRFFTDELDGLSQADKERVKNESLKYNDMLFMPYKGGYNFSLRLVWILKWLTSNHQFDFFLRIDDDYFLCLDRLVTELPNRPKESLYWGYIHCKHRMVRVDEGWMIMTQDLIQEAMKKLNTTLPCHPYGDQAVATWMINSQYNVTYFYDNERVVHAATAYKNATYLKANICKKYLALHGSYPKTMRKYWQVTKTYNNSYRNMTLPKIPRFEDKCRFSNKIFDVNGFYPELRFQMKLCKDEPTWRITNNEFYTREKYGELEY